LKKSGTDGFSGRFPYEQPKGSNMATDIFVIGLVALILIAGLILVLTSNSRDDAGEGKSSRNERS
jgi:hypothetical protein